MSQLNRPLSAEPGPECICGSEIREVPLPPALRELSGQESIWVHTESGDTRCYPDATDPGSRAITAEPVED